MPSYTGATITTRDMEFKQSKREKDYTHLTLYREPSWTTPSGATATTTIVYNVKDLLVKILLMHTNYSDAFDITLDHPTDFNAQQGNMRPYI